MKLRYTVRAAQELEQVLSYIGDRSPEGGRRIKARVQAVIDLIASHPQAGQLTSARRLRRVVVHPYSYLIFAAMDDEVVIHGVRHAARRRSSIPE